MWFKLAKVSFEMKLIWLPCNAVVATQHFQKLCYVFTLYFTRFFQKNCMLLRIEIIFFPLGSQSKSDHCRVASSIELVQEENSSFRIFCLVCHLVGTCTSCHMCLFTLSSHFVFPSLTLIFSAMVFIKKH